MGTHQFASNHSSFGPGRNVRAASPAAATAPATCPPASPMILAP
jgi:hypothetical protein